jgi:hypothetical protein
MGIDADKEDLHLFAILSGQRLINPCQIAQCRRADVRTMSKSEGEQHGFSSHLAELKRFSVLID